MNTHHIPYCTEIIVALVLISILFATLWWRARRKKKNYSSDVQVLASMIPQPMEPEVRTLVKYVTAPQHSGSGLNSGESSTLEKLGFRV